MADAYPGCLRHRKQGMVFWYLDQGVFKSYGCGILMNIIQVEKDTVKVIPQILQSASGLLMAIDIAGVHFEEASPCMDLSKNDLYAVSTSVC
ncbi:topless-related protein 3-like [Apium graveolens]|uniref:topless-related protein 3-like n=1 Tax=Apium graveolens TaxID=4045 RepID=UPI003D79261F